MSYRSAVCRSQSRFPKLVERQRCRQSSDIRGIPQDIRTIGSFSTTSITEFKALFQEEIPLLLKRNAKYGGSLPAISKWTEPSDPDGYSKLNVSYLRQFEMTMLPYEYILSREAASDRTREATSALLSHPENGDSTRNLWREFKSKLEPLAPGKDESFHSFYAPLAVMLDASSKYYRSEGINDVNLSRSSSSGLYIAQAQIRDLPPQLQADLPTPNIVLKAGKGDVYDANIWLGIPPTYTPLHKDPNPNLFVQLAGTKVVRLFSPQVGRSIYHAVQAQIHHGQQGNESIRGEEMMQGEEKRLLRAAVWKSQIADGFEISLRAGDALFIPKGWWHSITSHGPGINASVNWWFR